MPLDADSIKFLDEAKKGKARRFAMICKGQEIVSLIVYKRGSEEKHKKTAKQQGRGKFYGGVITGSGANIRFELESERYDKTPGKETILKQYLKNEAAFNCLPKYAIVESLPDVVEDDEDAVATDSPAATDAGIDPAESGKLARALKQLATAVGAAVKAAPERKETLFGKVSEAQAALKAGRLSDAKAAVLALGAMLKAPSPDDDEAETLRVEVNTWLDEIRIMKNDLAALVSADDIDAATVALGRQQLAGARSLLEETVRKLEGKLAALG